MENLGNQIKGKKGQKGQIQYYCQKCDFNCCKIYSWNRHLITSKHNTEIVFGAISKKSIYLCENCNKEFKTCAGLWKHKPKCKCITGETNLNNNNKTCVETNNEISNKDDIIMILIKQNTDLIKEQSNLIKEQSDIKNIILEIVKNGTNNEINNNTTHINSHNKAFNLNFFLNETCKNAMNIADFVDSIKLELSDLMELGEIGYVESMSKIITKNLNALDETIRPIHCTDKKRETFYIKDDDKWGKRRPRNETVTKTYFQNLK